MRKVAIMLVIMALTEGDIPTFRLDMAAKGC